MTDYIRKAVELADGWAITVSVLDGKTEVVVPPLGCLTIDDVASDTAVGRQFRDALSAQLVRQVDALGPDYEDMYWLECITGEATISRCGAEIVRVRGSDRAVNVIEAIVDSGALEPVDRGREQ